MLEDGDGPRHGLLHAMESALGRAPSSPRPAVRGGGRSSFRRPGNLRAHVARDGGARARGGGVPRRASELGHAPSWPMVHAGTTPSRVRPGGVFNGHGACFGGMASATVMLTNSVASRCHGRRVS